MMAKVDLKLDWCSYAAAKYAVEHWHYSKRMPKSKLAKIGAWENEHFIGCVIFGVGAGSSTKGGRFGLGDRFDMAELVRVALKDNHLTPTSRILSIAIKMLKRQSPKLRLLTSFADTAQEHLGIIYQASGWIYYGGREESNGAYCVRGEIVHPRTLHDRYGTGGQSVPWLRAHVDPKAERIKTPVKHHYLYPLDAEMRSRILPLAQPYPKRAGSADNGTADHQSARGGVIPTSALQA